MQVIGSTFEGVRRPGDFAWMIDQADYADALFVFNDNEEQFRAFRRDPGGRSGCSPGGGNAVIRPYRCANPPRAAGVPTGRRGQGYARLDPAVQEVIDDAIAVVGDLAASGRFGRIFYSAGEDEGDLGTGIFSVGEDVRRYIVLQLRALER